MVQKSKMVSFRLSEEEFTRLREACSLAGARNISELVRSAMQRVIDGADHDHQSAPAIHEQVRTLQDRVDFLSTEVDRIGRLLTQPAE